MPTAPLSSLALVKLNFDAGRGYLDQFVPMVAYSAYLCNTPVVALQDVHGKLKEEFALTIPQNTIKRILTRAAKQKLLVRHNGAYKVVPPAVEALQFTRIRSDIARQHSALLSRLRDFVLSSFSVIWTEDEAESAFLRFLEDHEIDVVYADQGEKVFENVGKSPKSAKYYVSAFIKHVSQTDPVTFISLPSAPRSRRVIMLLCGWRAS
jgi:hypothetical protein